MSNNVSGKITKFLDKVTGEKKDGSGQWVKQCYIVETEDDYNNLYCFEVFGDEKVEKLNKFNKVGDDVNVEFNVSTNEWNGKYFTTLQSWRIEKANVSVAEELPPLSEVNTKDDNSLPF